MLVRYKQMYSGLPKRLSYELVENKIVEGEHNGMKCLGYETKLMGFIPAQFMEEASEEDIPAVDVFIKILNIKYG